MRFRARGSVLLCLVILSLAFASVAVAGKEAPVNPFFAFDNGVGRGKWSPEQQAKTLKELGYAGIGYTGVQDLSKRLDAFREQGLKVFSLYVHCQPGKNPPYQVSSTGR